MIKLTIIAKNGTTIQLDIPTDGTASFSVPLVSTAVSALTVDQVPLQQPPDAVVPPAQPAGPAPAPDEREPEVAVQPEEAQSVDEINLETFEFPVDGGGTYVVGKALLKDFLFVFSEPHVRMEFVKARSWLLANPTKMKTARGMGRYLNAWLHRTAGVSKAPIKERVQTTFATSGNQISSGW